MQLHVLLFAAARDAAETDSISIEVTDHPSAGDVISSIGTAIPAIKPLLPSCRLAVNNEYVQDDASVSADDELALIPPVSGG